MMRTTLALAAAGLLLVAVPTLAAERSDRDRTDTVIALPTVILPAQTQSGIHIPVHSSGSISNNTSVSTNSGGNQGGNVVTGDQSSTVQVTNIGPVNNNTQVVLQGAQPVPATPGCTGRECPRIR